MRVTKKMVSALRQPLQESAYYDVGTAAPESLDVNDILDRYKSAPAPKEEPGLIEAGLRGVKQGVTFGFGDEITGALESAFTNKTYTQARDEARANDKAAEDAHPYGFGLGSILGTVGTGLATGGLAAGAAKLGTAGVAALAAGEGGLQAAGNSDADLMKGEVGQLAKDTAIGGAVGGVLGAGLHKILGHTVDTAVERRANQLNADIGEGGVPTVRKRLGQATNVQEVGVREGETAASTAAAGSENLQAARKIADTVAPEKVERSLGVNVIDSDHEFLKALSKGKKQAIDVADTRLNDLSRITAPIYKDVDAEFGGGLPLGHVVGELESAATAAKQDYSYNVADAIQEHADHFKEVWLKRSGSEAASKTWPQFLEENLAPALKESGGDHDAAVRAVSAQFKVAKTAELNEIIVPTADVRKLATRLQQEATRSMGSLSETERAVVKRQVATTAKGILDDHLNAAARALPEEMAPKIQQLRDANDKIFVYASVRQALEDSAKTTATKGPGLMASLTGASLPGLAGLAMSGGNPAGFVAGAVGAKAAQAGAKKLDRAATFALSKLVRAARTGDATSQMALDAIQAGVPVALANTIMSSVGQPLASAGGAAAIDGVASAFNGIGHGGHGHPGEEE